MQECLCCRNFSDKSNFDKIVAHHEFSVRSASARLGREVCMRAVAVCGTVAFQESAQVYQVRETRAITSFLALACSVPVSNDEMVINSCVILYHHCRSGVPNMCCIFWKVRLERSALGLFSSELVWRHWSWVSGVGRVMLSILAWETLYIWQSCGGSQASYKNCMRHKLFLRHVQAVLCMTTCCASICKKQR